MHSLFWLRSGDTPFSDTNRSAEVSDTTGTCGYEVSTPVPLVDDPAGPSPPRRSKQALEGRGEGIEEQGNTRCSFHSSTWKHGLVRVMLSRGKILMYSLFWVSLPCNAIF